MEIWMYVCTYYRYILWDVSCMCECEDYKVYLFIKCVWCLPFVSMWVGAHPWDCTFDRFLQDSYFWFFLLWREQTTLVGAWYYLRLLLHAVSVVILLLYNSIVEQGTTPFPTSLSAFDNSLSLSCLVVTITADMPIYGRGIKHNIMRTGRTTATCDNP